MAKTAAVSYAQTLYQQGIVTFMFQVVCFNPLASEFLEETVI